MRNGMIRRGAMAGLFLATLSCQFCLAQEHKAINLSPARGLPFSDGVIAGNTMYVAGQEGFEASVDVVRGVAGHAAYRDVESKADTMIRSVRGAEDIGDELRRIDRAHPAVAVVEAAVPALVKRAQAWKARAGQKFEYTGAIGRARASLDDAERERRIDTRSHEAARGSSVMTFVMWALVVVTAVLIASWLVSELSRRGGDAELGFDPDAGDRVQAASAAIIERPLGDADELATARRLVAKRVAASRGRPLPARMRRLVGVLARKGYPPGLAFRLVRDAMAERDESAEFAGQVDVDSLAEAVDSADASARGSGDGET